MDNKRVLVALKGYIGDAVMAEPTIRALADGGFEPFLYSSPVVHDLFVDRFEPSRRLTTSSSRSLSATMGEAAKLRRLQLSTAILVNNSFRSALTARLAGIKVRIGFSKEKRDFLLTHKVAFRSEEFQALSDARLLEPLGLDVPNPRPKLAPLDEDMKGFRTRATIGFQPGARDPWKRLPESLAVQIACSLVGRGERLAILGGPEERAQATAVLKAIGDSGEDHVGALSIRQTLGCIAHLNGCFGGDTGVMHLSAASGCSTVQIFNSDRAAKWGHDYPPNRVVNARNGDMSQLDPDQIVGEICGIRLATSLR